MGFLCFYVLGDGVKHLKKSVHQHFMRGKFLMIDGLDGCGKGTFLQAMKEEALTRGKKLFDLHEFWEREKRHPRVEEFAEFDLLLSSEPTFVGEGKRIREELIRKDKVYPAKVIAEAYATDREALYNHVLKPALERGIGVIQSRSVSTSLVYQPLDAELKGEELTLEEVEALPGNAQALSKEWIPDLVVIPTVSDVHELLRRLAAREKQDDASFERYDFQLNAKERFESEWFQQIFLSKGAKVVYADAETSIAHSRSEAERLYLELFQN